MNTSNNRTRSGGRGFASMDPRKQQAAASRGGRTTAERYDMSERGRKGGMNSHKNR